MIIRTRIFYSQWSRHGALYAYYIQFVKFKDLTHFFTYFLHNVSGYFLDRINRIDWIFISIKETEKPKRDNIAMTEFNVIPYQVSFFFP